MRVVSAEQMRELERAAINEYGIPGMILMENAALAVVQEIRQYFKETRQIDLSKGKGVIFAGKGNNGGDGLAVARHLSVAGMEVAVFLLAQPHEYHGDGATNLRLFQGLGIKYYIINDDKQLRLVRLALAQADVIVDALYGTGMKGALPPLAEACVEEINRSRGYIVAVDLPSGLEADTGRVYRTAVKAHTTVTFGLPKLGHFLGAGPEYSGKVVVDPISIPSRYLEREEITNFVLTDSYIGQLLPRRSLDGHKGTHGRGILAGGSRGMSGAVILAGRGALRSGIGLVQLVVPESIGKVVDGGLIEGTVWSPPAQEGAGDTLDLSALPLILERCQGAKTLAIGPGLGQNPQFKTVLAEVLRTLSIPIVLDADALNLVAQEPELLSWREGRGPLILTPHPGEMARLCQCGVPEVQENRLELAVSKAVEWGAVVVLKGAITIVAAPDGRAFLNPTGNPGLGTGGTGDVLTGSILAWLAQGMDVVEAACLGVYLHGKAGDRLARQMGWGGFTAAEVADALPLARYDLEKEMSPLIRRGS